jgi:hypothetical protein
VGGTGKSAVLITGNSPVSSIRGVKKWRSLEDQSEYMALATLLFSDGQANSDLQDKLQSDTTARVCCSIC